MTLKILKHPMIGCRAPSVPRVSSALFFSFCAAMFLPSTVCADDLAISVYGNAMIPLAASAPFFNAGVMTEAGASYTLANGFGAEIDAVYSRSPLESGPTLALIGASLGGRYVRSLGTAFSLGATAGIGVYTSSIDGALPGSILEDAGGLGMSADAGLFFAFRVVPAFELSVEARYLKLFNLYDGLTAGLRVSYVIDATKSTRPRVEKTVRSGLEEATGVTLARVELESIFPVFYSYYNGNHFGELTLHNNEKKPVSNLRVSYFMQRYMDSPAILLDGAQLGAGQDTTIPVTGLFNDSILNITEGTLVVTEFTLSYTLDGKPHSTTIAKPLRILDRNSMSWFDDRCAAAYVTAKDPAVLNFSKNVVGAVAGRDAFTLDRGLQAAVAIHASLELYGMNYLVDPKSSYAAISGSKGAIDFLQFPRQTLEYRSGDCDDLSILYAALLEAAGVETAFITTPGHIFIAIAMDGDEATIRRLFSSAADFIYSNGKAWLPLEITERHGGFLKAWKLGASGWRENLAAGEARLHPVREAWTVFEPVAMPGSSSTVVPPRGAALDTRYDETMKAIVERELAPQESRLKLEIEKSQGSVKLRNSLGILYTRYGLYARAGEQFLAILKEKKYLPALINMGNVEFVGRDYAAARAYFAEAYGLHESNTGALVGLLLTSYELGDQAGVARYFQEIKKLDAALSERFAYALRAGSGEGRASATTDTRETVLWTE